MRHHTKDLGDIGVIKAELNAMEQGYIVSRPSTEHAPFDLVIWSQETGARTVQVKARSLTTTTGHRQSEGYIQVAFRSTWSDSNGTHTRAVNKDEIDLYAVYCPDTDGVYWLDPRNYGKSINIRINPPANNQKKNVHLAKDMVVIPR